MDTLRNALLIRMLFLSLGKCMTPPPPSIKMLRIQEETRGYVPHLLGLCGQLVINLSIHLASVLVLVF